MKLIRVAPVTVKERTSDTTGQRQFVVTSRDGAHEVVVCYVGDNPDLRLIRLAGAETLREQIARMLLAKEPV